MILFSNALSDIVPHLSNIYILDLMPYTGNLVDSMYSQPSVIQNSLIQKPRNLDRISRNGHDTFFLPKYQVTLKTLRYSEICYLEDISKVP